MNTSNLLIINNISYNTLKRVFKKIKINNETGCWDWLGFTSQGYGQIRINKKLYRIHRFMYAWLVSPIPNGKGKNIPVLNHICNNRSCCNPLHLELISDTENILKGNGATAINHRKTHCKKGHLLHPANKNGYRRCMICHREWNRKNYAKNPLKFIIKSRERYARTRNII